MKTFEIVYCYLNEPGRYVIKLDARDFDHLIEKFFDLKDSNADIIYVNEL